MSQISTLKSAGLINLVKDDENFTPYFRYVSLLTLVFVLMNESAFPPFTRIYALAGILLTVFFVNKWYWTGMFVIALMTFLTGSIWTYDNHQWAILYWLLAMAIYAFVRKDHLLQQTARYLIGFIFLFATGWKIAAEEFRSSDFFEVTGHTESRLTEFMIALGLMPPTVKTNSRGIDRWSDPEYGTQGFTLIVSDYLDTFWSLLTYATYIVEGGLALLFLAPLATRISWVRDLMLATFFVGTYVMVPVSGFGTLLAVMGFAASNLDFKRRITLYAGLVILMEIIPTRMLILSLFGIGT